MLHKLHGVAIAAFLGVGALLVFPAAKADAASLPVTNVDLKAETFNGDLLHEVGRRDDRRRQWFYDRRSHGNRYYYPYRKYRYQYGGYWYDRPYWNLAVPFVYLQPPPRYYARRSYGIAHIDWCYARYRSYEARSNTWVSYSGRVRQCISPYGP